MSLAANSQVSEILQKTLSIKNEDRKNAEAEIKRLTKIPGIAGAFLSLIRDERESPQTRMAASLALKNFIRENWSGEGTAPLLEDEREQLRKAILESLFQLSSIYRRQMSQTLCYIGRCDFPEKWPQLIEVIGNCLSLATDFDKLVTSLSTLEELVKRYRYEMRSNKLWSEINIVLGAVAEPLTKLYSKMLQYIPTEGTVDSLGYSERISWLEILLLSMKIYHALISQDLPAYFEDNLTPWMNGSLQLLSMNLPSVEEFAIDSEANALESLKCEICEVATLFSQRYEDCFGVYTQSFIGATWKLLVDIDSRIRFDSLVNAAFGFLSAISQRMQYAHHFQGEGVLQAICENVIIKNLSLRNEDLVMYQDEPFEFLKRDIEGSDAETRRKGATDFVRALCKQFEPEVFQILSKVIVTFLNNYGQNPSENFIKKDVVYYLVTAMASKTTTAKHGATSTSQLISVSDFYEKHVREDLLNEDPNFVPILRNDALKFLVLFRNQINPNFIIEFFSGKNNQLSSSVVHLLSSDFVLLHHYVAYAVERLLLLRTADGQLMLNSENIPVHNLIDGFFNCFSHPTAYNSHYIMKAIMRCFNIIDIESVKSAHIYVSRLEQMVLEAIQRPIDAQFVHFVFESLCVLIRKVYAMVDGGIDKQVIPIIENIIRKDVIDLIPYALQIIALLLDQSQIECLRCQSVTQEQYLCFFPYLLKDDLWSHSANIPALMLVFESFITCFPTVVFGSEYVERVLGCYQYLIASKVLDQHGFRLANSFIIHIDSYEKLSSRNVILPMLNRMQQLKTPKYTRHFVLFLCRFAMIRGGASLAHSFESIQPGIFLMVIEKVLVVEMNGMSQSHTYEEKRIITIGVSSIIIETVNILGPTFASLVEGVVGILEAFDHRKISGVKETLPGKEDVDDQYAEMNGKEYSDPYCKLSYAQHQDTVGGEVTNIKAHFANAVFIHAYRVDQQSVLCLSAEVKKNLKAYLAGA